MGPALRRASEWGRFRSGHELACPTRPAISTERSCPLRMRQQRLGARVPDHLPEAADIGAVELPKLRRARVRRRDVAYVASPGTAR
jgi:hypothetical protein